MHIWMENMMEEQLELQLQPGLSDMAISRQTWRFSNSFGDLIFEMATGDFCGDFSSEWRFSWRFYTH